MMSLEELECVYSGRDTAPKEISFVALQRELERHAEQLRRMMRGILRGFERMNEQAGPADGQTEKFST